MLGGKSALKPLQEVGGEECHMPYELSADSIVWKVYYAPSLQDYCCRKVHKGTVQRQPHLQTPTLAPGRKNTNTQRLQKNMSVNESKNPWILTVNIWSDLVILSKWYGVSFHVQDAGDGVTLGKGRKCADQFASMIKVAAVCTIEPHVSGGMVVVISHWPAWNTNTCALIASVLFGNVELRRAVRFRLLNNLVLTEKKPQ